MKHSVTIDDIERLSKECDNLILNSARNCGKSYAVLTFLIKEAYREKGHFLLIRRLKDEAKDIVTNKYLNHKTLPSFIKKITKNKYDSIQCFRKTIYLCVNNKRSLEIGYVTSLQHQVEDKGAQAPDCFWCLFEEYCTNRYYLDNEGDTLANLLSTYMRSRRGKTFLLGNKDTRFNYYNDYWGLNMSIQKNDTIDTYKKLNLDGKEIIIKCWDIKKVEEASFVAFGKSAKNIDGNDYYVAEQAKLNIDINSYDSIYSIFVSAQKIVFRCILIDYDGNIVWYVMPHTTDIKDKNARVISDEYSLNLMHSRGFIPFTIEEKLAFDLLLNKSKVFYCSDRCGTDFKQAVNLIKRASLNV